MPKFILIALIALVFAGNRMQTIHPEKKPNLTISTASMAPDTILAVTKQVVDGRQFTLQRSTQVGLVVFNEKQQVIYRDSSYVSDARFTDFNNDGYKDIWIVRPGNIPGVRGLLLYNKAAGSFKEVPNFDRFPASQRIKGTHCYYSYHRSGCADMNWTSDLFIITNFKVVKIGTINGYECADSNRKDGIYIYKVANGKNVKLKQLGIATINRYKSYKWGFIQSYWQKQYKLFL